jgi:hypothetical protein
MPAGREEFDRARLLAALDVLRQLPGLESLRAGLADLQARLGESALLAAAAVSEAGRVALRRDVLLAELRQAGEAYTLERARHYLRRLRNGIARPHNGKVNDINLARWKEYDEVLTDSLWLIEKRDTSGAHLGHYWGNFVPQIPHQLLQRYTKRGEWVLDAFAGSGTTLIECRRLGRNGLGVELNPTVAEQARALVNSEANPHAVATDLLVGDSREVDIAAALAERGARQVQLLLLHPPYHDIIKFSDDARDLSNAASCAEFLRGFAQAVEHVTPCLAAGRHCALVIGDKYAKGEWLPLGFYCMNEVLRRGYSLKSIVVKNFEQTRAKRSQEELWRYRALAGGFYVFKHEYVIIFQKR